MCYVHVGNVLVLTGPPKVEGVMFGNNVVKNGKIKQDITWNVPVLRYTVFEQYIIRFADSLQALLNRMARTESKESTTTLQFDFHSSTITYYVRVAVKSTKGRGDFSDPVSITYTSEYYGHRYIYTYGMYAQKRLLNHTAPGPPQDLTLVNRTCHSVTFQWSPPDDTGRLDVTGYDILHNGTPVATITGTVYTLEGLTPDTGHTISVRTTNAIGPSELERTLTAATIGRGTYLYVYTQLFLH